MAELANLRVKMPVWRLRFGALLCVFLRLFPMTEARKHRIADRLAAWVAAGVK